MKWIQRLARLGSRLLMVYLGAWLLILLPDTPGDDLLRYKNAVVVFAAIVLTGKYLFDTFFYERFPC